jgi:hypothetical protein
MRKIVLRTFALATLLSALAGGVAWAQVPVPAARTADPVVCPSTGQTIPAGTLASELDSLCPPAGNARSSDAMNQAAANAAYDIGYALGEKLGEALFGNKANNEAAAAAAAEAERQRMLDVVRQRALAEQKRQEMYDRLSRSLKLSGLATLSLKGFDNDYNSGMQLKGFGNAPSGAGGDLQLKGLGNSAASGSGNAGDPKSVLVTAPFGLGGNPCPATPVDPNLVDLRNTPPGACPGEATGDPHVVDLRDVQQGVNLAVVAGNAAPADQPLILDQALAAANGEQSIQVNLASGANAPAVSADGLRAFQQANAAYRQARETAYQRQQAFNVEEEKHEMAYAIVGTYQSELESDFKLDIDAMTLAQREETMASIFKAATQERIAYGKTWAEYLAASAQYDFDKLAAEDELMQLAQTGSYNPEILTKGPPESDLRLLLPLPPVATQVPTKADLDLVLDFGAPREPARAVGEMPLDPPWENRLGAEQLQEFPPAVVHAYKSDSSFQQQMNAQYQAIFGLRDRDAHEVLSSVGNAFDQKVADLQNQGLAQTGVSITAQEKANPQLRAQLQQIRTELEADAHWRFERIDWQANDKWQAWIEAQNARLTGRPIPVYVPGP